jgi:hypothetical protein
MFNLLLIKQTNILTYSYDQIQPENLAFTYFQILQK